MTTLRSKLPIILSITASNLLVVLISIFEDANLESVAKVFWFQAFVVFVLNLCGVLSAEYVNRDSRAFLDQSILTSKAISFAMIFFFNGIFLAGYFAAFFIWLNTDESLWWTVVFIAKCSALFLINNVYLFNRERENGLYKELIGDGEVMGFVFRIQAVMIPCLVFLSTKKNWNIDYTSEQLLLVLLIIAIFDSAIQIMKVEEDEKKLRIIESVERGEKAG